MSEPRVELTRVLRVYRVTCSACGTVNHALKTEREAAEAGDAHENWHNVNRRIAQAESENDQ